MELWLAGKIARGCHCTYCNYNSSTFSIAVYLSPCCLSPCFLSPCCLSPCFLSSCCLSPCCLSPCCLSHCVLSPCCLSLIVYPLLVYLLVVYPLLVYLLVFYPLVVYPLIVYPLVVYLLVFYPLVVYPLVVYLIVFYPLVVYPLIVYPLLFTPLLSIPLFIVFALVNCLLCFVFIAVRYGRVPKHSKSQDDRSVSSSDSSLDQSALESRQLAIYDVILSVSQAHHTHCAVTSDKVNGIHRKSATLVRGSHPLWFSFAPDVLVSTFIPLILSYWDQMVRT